MNQSVFSSDREPSFGLASFRQASEGQGPQGGPLRQTRQTNRISACSILWHDVSDGERGEHSY